MRFFMRFFHWFSQRFSLWTIVRRRCYFCGHGWEEKYLDEPRYIIIENPTQCPNCLMKHAWSLHEDQ